MHAPKPALKISHSAKRHARCPKSIVTIQQKYEPYSSVTIPAHDERPAIGESRSGLRFGIDRDPSRAVAIRVEGKLLLSIGRGFVGEFGDGGAKQGKGGAADQPGGPVAFVQPNTILSNHIVGKCSVRPGGCDAASQRSADVAIKVPR